MRILYIMQVNWNWIKQRPQFIAMKLAKENDVLVLCPHSYHKEGMCNNEHDGLSLKEIFMIPFSGRFSCLKRINESLIKHRINGFVNKFKPDVVWIGSPNYAKYLSEGNYTIVYDCMDDYYSMEKNDEVLLNEKKACKLADVIFTSSISLKNKLIERYGVDKNIVYLIRNGYEPEIIDYASYKENDALFHIGYVGTISEWFDFDSIHKLLDKFDNIVIDLYGPCSDVIKEKEKKYKRINFWGSVNHADIYNNIAHVDALIMPFLINDITRSVDPVKLYEYINYNKNIISIWYEEISRFDKFVYFYNNSSELIDIVSALISNNTLKYSDEIKQIFLNENSWSQRSSMIMSVLKKDII